MPASSSREETIFKAALAASSEDERVALLDRECAGDAALRASVESLLQASAAAEDFLGEPIALTQVEADLGKTVIDRSAAAGPSTVNLPPESYAVGGEIASGGMGSILEAQDRKLGRKVAMKVMRLEAAVSEDARRRFVREATVLARLEHPNIVPIHELGWDTEGRLFYTMKLVQGRTLQAVIHGLKSGDPDFVRHYTLDRRLTIFRKICDALSLAHARGVIHRDLKPENVMVGEFGEVLVMDWGIAKILGDAAQAAEESAQRAESLQPGTSERFRTLAVAELQKTVAELTMEGTVIGTPHYMSPEQAAGRVTELDQQSDVFSLGAILYALLALRPPFEGATIDALLEKVSHAQVTPLDATRLPSALVSVVMKALALKKPARYATVAELSADVEKYQGGFATSAENASLFTQLRLLVQRHRREFTIGFAALVLLVGATVWFVVNITRERNRAEKTLAELRGTAPTFVAQARALVEQGKLDDALAKLGYAIDLDRKNADYQLQRAHLLEAAQRFDEAIPAYRDVLALDASNASARDNLALCERLRQANGGAPQLRREWQMELLDALLHENRAVEAGPLAALVGKDSGAIEAALRARLKEYKAQPGWWDTRVQKVSNGTFKVELQKLKIGDLSVLEGMPISSLNFSDTDLTDLAKLPRLPLTALNITHTPVTDLSPLRGLKLEQLYATGCRISDLEPLRGMPLQLIAAVDAEVADLAPLTGMPLQDLNLQNGHTQSLEPLSGMPLRRLMLFKSRFPLDLTPLANCRELEEIVIPANASNVSALRGLPKLARIWMDSHQDALIPADKFWAEFQPDWDSWGKLLFAFKKGGVTLDERNFVTKLPDGTLDVRLYSTALSDLTPVAGLRISQLVLTNTKVRDLTPLRDLPLHELIVAGTQVDDLAPLHGLPLKFLGADGTAVTDLEPLRGMPLARVNLNNTHVTSVAPLLDCRELESAILPKSVRDVEVLRDHPSLKFLSIGAGGRQGLAKQTVEEFWQEFDTPKGKKKK